MAARVAIASLEETYEAAIALLARKARTAHEVAEALRDRGAEEEWVESVLARLRAHRHLDDAVLAEDQAFALVEGKGMAPALAVQMLEERGVPSSVAREAVEAVRDGRSDTVLCRAALARLTTGAGSRDSIGRLARALARLGYEGEVVEAALERDEAS